MRGSPRVLLGRALPAVAIVAAAGVGGFLAFGLVARRPHSFEASRVRTAAIAGSASVKESARRIPARAAQPSPDRLPAIAFKNRRGLRRRLTHWRGRPLLVNFWAPWCSPCREEIPLLERLSRERKSGSPQVIGVAVDTRAAVLAYARRAQIQYPLLIGERAGLEAVHALGMEAVFPFSVFVDARGRIVTFKVGELHLSEAGLILERIREIDGGRLSLAAAQRQIATDLSRLAVTRAKRMASGART